jgi:phospholipase C
VRVTFWGLALAVVACGHAPGGDPRDAATADAIAGAIDAPPAASDARPDALTRSNIAHVVIVVQENHSFDSYFGRWCTAPAGAGVPSCTQGRSCCEAAPATDAAGHAPIVLDDAANGAHDPDHTHTCEAAEMHGGAMDRYAAGASGCSDSRNVAIASAATVATYHDLASTYALADRYFQPEIGSSSANDMYFAVAQHVFTDNEWKPDSNGAGCTLPATRKTLTGVTTIADLLIAHGDSFGFYAQGYAAMLAATFCPSAPSDCPFGLPTTPCDYDPSDVPFEYYAQFLDNPTYMKDYADLAADVAAGSLPSVAFVKFVGYQNEHPGYGTRISPGEQRVAEVVNLIAGSAYGSDTLILITWDEGGGLWDHVTPPPAIDGQPYGTRVPLLAVGTFARRGEVSHVEMEHASVVKFLEWNFLGGVTGQLGARDQLVNNLGSLLDPAKTGLVVPVH